MPPLPTATYFLDAHKGTPLTRGVVVLLDPLSGVIVLRNSLSRRLSGRLVRIGKPLDWDPNKGIESLSNNFVRLAFKHDESRRADDIDTLRRELAHLVTTVPDEIAGQHYLVNHIGLAFPVQHPKPIVLRKGHRSTLATMTMFDVFAPHAKDPRIRYVIPHVVCVRPTNAWWTTVKETMYEILKQHYPGITLDHFHQIEAHRDDAHGGDETVMRLSVPYPIPLYEMTPAALQTLRRLR